MIRAVIGFAFSVGLLGAPVTPASGRTDPQADFDQRDVAPAQPVIPERVFRLEDFAPVADWKALNTDVFARAIAAVAKAGGGTLVVPAGLYSTGPIELCSGINLHLNAGATLRFAPAESPSPDVKLSPLLLARNVHDVMISGNGTIYGSGETWWPAVHESMHARRRAPKRPYLVCFDACQRVRMEGVTLTHAPEFNLVPTHCTDVTIEGVTIFNPTDDNTPCDGIDPALVRERMQKEYDDESPNTDGIDPMDCQRVLIARCRIDTGDDCIAIKPNSGEFSRDILITDCTFLHGHGCSIGSGTQGGLRNVTVRRCTFSGTKVGVHLKSARDRGGLVEDVTFSDLTMTNVGEAILITSYYDAIDISIYYRPYMKKFSIDLANGGHDPIQPVTATTPRWHNIVIRNVTATCLWEAGLILGLPEMPARDVVLENINITSTEGLRINYAKNVTLRNVHIANSKGPALVVGDTVEGLTQ